MWENNVNLYITTYCITNKKQKKYNKINENWRKDSNRILTNSLFFYSSFFHLKKKIFVALLKRILINIRELIVFRVVEAFICMVIFLLTFMRVLQSVNGQFGAVLPLYRILFLSFYFSINVNFFNFV